MINSVGNLFIPLLIRPSLFTPLTFPSTSFPSLFSLLFLLVSQRTQALSPWIPVPLCSLTTAMHRVLKDTAFYLFPNPEIPGDWGSGWLWICHISLLPFSSWLLLNLSLLCHILPPPLLAVPLFSVLAPNPNCHIILYLAICKWNQLMNDIALGTHIPRQRILKSPFCGCQAFLTLAVEKPTQKHINFIKVN